MKERLGEIRDIFKRNPFTILPVLGLLMPGLTQEERRDLAYCQAITCLSIALIGSAGASGLEALGKENISDFVSSVSAVFGFSGSVSALFGLVLRDKMRKNQE